MLIKLDPDRELYVAWSLATNSPTAWGTRAELEARNDPDIPEDGFDRADRQGSTPKFVDDNPNCLYGWNDPDIIVDHVPGLPRRTGGHWTLPRAKLGDYLDASDPPDVARLSSLITWAEYEYDGVPAPPEPEYST